MSTLDLRGNLTEYSVKLITEVCISCGIPFGIPTNYQQVIKDTHKSFYCPNGHGQHYPGKSNEEKLREELLQKKNEVAQLAASKIQIENQLDKANAKLSKVSKGECPCCGKLYKHLASHMKTKHPKGK